MLYTLSMLFILKGVCALSCNTFWNAKQKGTYIRTIFVCSVLNVDSATNKNTYKVLGACWIASSYNKNATCVTEVINALSLHILFDGMEFTLQVRELKKQGCHQQSDCKVGYVTVATTCWEIIWEPHNIKYVTVIHDQCKEIVKR